MHPILNLLAAFLISAGALAIFYRISGYLRQFPRGHVYGSPNAFFITAVWVLLMVGPAIGTVPDTIVYRAASAVLAVAFAAFGFALVLRDIRAHS